MNIKTTRILTATGVGPIMNHVLYGKENERIRLLYGTKADATDMLNDALAYKCKYCIRHFSISPQGEISEDTYKKIYKAIVQWYNAKGHNVIIVEHTKERASGENNNRHWHFLLSEVSSVTGRVLPTKFSKMLNEKISRLLELELGHQTIKGKHNCAVINSLKEEGLLKEAEALEAAGINIGECSKSAFSSGQHQKLKKEGVNLAQIKSDVRESWKDWKPETQVPFTLEKYGMRISKGNKKNVWVISLDGKVVGALHRLAGVTVSEANERMQESLQMKMNYIEKTRQKALIRNTESKSSFISTFAVANGKGASLILNFAIMKIAVAMAETLMISLKGLFTRDRVLNEKKDSEIREIVKEKKSVTNVKATNEKKVLKGAALYEELNRLAKNYVKARMRGEQKLRSELKYELMELGMLGANRIRRIDDVFQHAETKTILVLQDCDPLKFTQKLEEVEFLIQQERFRDVEENIDELEMGCKDCTSSFKC